MPGRASEPAGGLDSTAADCGLLERDPWPWPCELELGRRAGRSESRGRGGEAEVLEDPAHDRPVRDERDEPAPAAAPGAGEKAPTAASRASRMRRRARRLISSQAVLGGQKGRLRRLSVAFLASSKRALPRDGDFQRPARAPSRPARGTCSTARAASVRRHRSRAAPASPGRRCAALFAGRRFLDGGRSSARS